MNRQFFKTFSIFLINICIALAILLNACFAFPNTPSALNKYPISSIEFANIHTAQNEGGIFRTSIFWEKNESVQEIDIDNSNEKDIFHFIGDVNKLFHFFHLLLSETIATFLIQNQSSFSFHPRKIFLMISNIRI